MNSEQKKQQKEIQEKMNNNGQLQEKGVECRSLAHVPAPCSVLFAFHKHTPKLELNTCPTLNPKLGPAWCPEIRSTHWSL